jgi:hypothetical protein
MVRLLYMYDLYTSFQIRVVRQVGITARNLSRPGSDVHPWHNFLQN